MKILDTPRSNKLGLAVAFQSRYGLCLRAMVMPKEQSSRPRASASGALWATSPAPGAAKLTDEQHERWIVAAGNVLSGQPDGLRTPYRRAILR